MTPFDMVPGAWVRLPAKPEWGLGQVQSADGPRVTVNFEQAGKQLIRVDNANLVVVEPPDGPPGMGRT